MDLPDWALFLACAFGAEVIGTMAGFGAATILTPVAALFMDIKTAIAVVAAFHLFGNASRLYFSAGTSTGAYGCSSASPESSPAYWVPRPRPGCPPRR